MKNELTREVITYLFIYRFMYPQHFNYLLSQGMGVRWMPSWYLFSQHSKLKNE